MGSVLDRMLGQIAQLETEVRSLLPGKEWELPRSHLSRTQATTFQRISYLQSTLTLRRKRSNFFPGVEFGEPAWDMLMELRLSGLRKRRLSVSSLTIASSVPATTALRWIGALVDLGIILREDDPDDGRRVFVRLSTETETAMDRFLDHALATRQT
jgi:DNA-binding MarR family transcriptional regulator